MGFWDKGDERPEEVGGLAELEAACIEELTATEKSFRDRMKNESSRFRDMCDTEYWFCVCFTSREQKNEFLEKVGLDTETKYFDGKEVAAAFKKSIKTPDLEFAKIKSFDKDFVERAREV